MAWDQGYYQEPNQYYDPNYGYYDPAWGAQPEEPQEDTESEKLRKDQEETERLEALQSNRLFLKKVKKQCVKEDFSDLAKLQLFLFEVLIESLEVKSDSSLGLLKDEDVSFVSARVRFLDSPYMEICETNQKSDGSQRAGTFTDTDYFEKLNEAGFEHTKPSSKGTYSGTESMGRSGERSSTKSGESGAEEVEVNTKWENASGKSCLFSMSPLMMIHDLDNYPVVLQVVRCGLSEDEEEINEPVGYAQFRLPEEFSLSVLQSCKTGVILPVSSVHREVCDVRNVFGVKKGKVEVFVRLSSFGPVIITSFQTTGPDRKYVFKPSPMSSNFKDSEEHDPSPQNQLKPIIAEEDNTVGCTVLNNYDEFQVPVIWKSKKGMCDFGGSLFSASEEGSVRAASIGSLRLPLSSQLDLCRDVIPPGDLRKVNMGEPVCDWHNLLGAAVKNSPGRNCGCIPIKLNQQSAPMSKYKSEPFCNEITGNTPQGITMSPREASTSSKPAKMVLPVQDYPKSGDSDCGCNCPEIREYLNAATRPFKL